MEKTALELSNVSKQYKDFTLDNISFKVPQGSIVGLIGETVLEKVRQSTLF